MICTCKQCGEKFKLTDSEIKFYKDKNLNIPKRCEECRKKNKQQKQENKGINQGTRQSKQRVLYHQSGHTKKSSGTGKFDNKFRKNYYVLTAAIMIVLLVVAFFTDILPWNTQNESTVSIPENTQVSNTDEISNTITFRNEKLLNEHYDKHGKEMGYSSANEYEVAAVNVVNNSDVLHKTEAEDGDDVYYLQDSNEFVIVSTDGYIRTYFSPDDGIEYYNRQ